MAHPETLAQQELIEPARILADRFIQRTDMYPRQAKSGAYYAVKQPLTDQLLFDHLRGDITLGAYVLDASSHARYMVLDADDEPDRRRLQALAQVLDSLGLPTYTEASRRGSHLWFFFDAPRPGREVRQFGKGLIAYFNLADVELYPKQDQLRTGPGSLIRLPFGIHRKSGRRYGFTTPQGEPLAPTLRQQLAFLKDPQTVPERLLAHYQGYSAAPAPKPPLEVVEGQGETVSERIKGAVSCERFISQYVELDARGRGLCPFHNDHLSSFSVNREENYWHCFAGCGGGSIIDFYILWQQAVEKQPADFKSAVKDLAELLLK